MRSPGGTSYIAHGERLAAGLAADVVLPGAESGRRLVVGEAVVVEVRACDHRILAPGPDGRGVARGEASGQDGRGIAPGEAADQRTIRNTPRMNGWIRQKNV